MYYEANQLYLLWCFSLRHIRRLDTSWASHNAILTRIWCKLDWVKYPSYNESNPEHAELMRRVKPLIGAVGTPTPASFEEALTGAGFRVTRSDNASVATDGLQSPLIDKVDLYFRSVRRIIGGLVKVHALPPHFKTLIDRLCLDGKAFVKMDEMRLITTSYRIIAEKPM